MNNPDRSPSSPSLDAPSPDDAFEVGTTTLDLDTVSDKDLASLSVADERATSPILNLQTASGLSLVIAGLIYLLTELGVRPSPLLGIDTVVPWLIGTAVILLGGGLLAWRRPPSSPSHPPSAPTSMPSSSPSAPNPESDDKQPPAAKRLVRSRTDKKLLGVCGGLADYFNLDPTLIRIAFVVGTLFFGSLLIAYFGFAFAMPKAPPSDSNKRPTLPNDAPPSDGPR